jgi:hypothetical protein
MSTLLEKIQDSSNYNAKLIKLLAKFPDLKEHQNRWKNIRYISPSVNSIVDRVEIRHSCGCCCDAALIVSAYIHVDDFDVYADPVEIYVGEKCDSGDRPLDSWESMLKKHHLPENIIKQVQEYFERNKVEQNKDED